MKTRLSWIPVFLMAAALVATGCTKVQVVGAAKKASDTDLTQTPSMDPSNLPTETAVSRGFMISAGGGLSRGSGIMLQGVIGTVTSVNAVVQQGSGVTLVPSDPMPARTTQ